VAKPESNVAIRIKSDRSPTATKYKLDITCTNPGMIYFLNTISKDYMDAASLADMKKRLDRTAAGSALFEQVGYKIIEKGGVYQTIEFKMMTNQIHSF
jgi:hypothetical protein